MEHVITNNQKFTNNDINKHYTNLHAIFFSYYKLFWFFISGHVSLQYVESSLWNDDLHNTKFHDHENHPFFGSINIVSPFDFHHFNHVFTQTLDPYPIDFDRMALAGEWNNHCHPDLCFCTRINLDVLRLHPNKLCQTYCMHITSTINYLI